MRVLSTVRPTAEQLPIVADSKPGYRLIRGAAGSGKTTTAILRLKQLCADRLKRRQREGTLAPVRVLLLTYNTTLQAYITALAEAQVSGDPGLVLEISTFGKWAKDLVGDVNIIDGGRSALIMKALLHNVIPSSAPIDYFVDELEYLMSRFLPEELDKYLTIKRVGRGTAPQVAGPLRGRLLGEVTPAYEQAKLKKHVIDWNDLALLAIDAECPPYDVVIVDEAQDFSANQVRAVLAHTNSDTSVTFVLDAMQRIYPRHFTWREVGVDITGASSARVYKLTSNHRNTPEIARFALPLVEGLPLDDDGSLPDFTSCVTDPGRLPEIISGLYRQQFSYMLEFVLNEVDLTTETVAILQPRGGQWFDFARTTLRNRGIPFCDLQRRGEWPTGPANVGLSTIHSAKGLEFDHVLLPGLNQEVTPHGSEEGDGSLDQYRRLLAMGIGRARKSVHIGYKPSDVSSLLSYLDPDTYKKVEF